MSADGSVTHWLNQLASEDDSVAERELFDRYFGKLVEVARQKLQAASRSIGERKGGPRKGQRKAQKHRPDDYAGEFGYGRCTTADTTCSGAPQIRHV